MLVKKALCSVWFLFHLEKNTPGKMKIKKFKINEKQKLKQSMLLVIRFVDTVNLHLCYLWCILYNKPKSCLYHSMEPD